jgi:hypothetical protein
VSGGQYCSGIVGAAIGGTNSIRNCWMAASVTSQGNDIGGILGSGTTSSVTISNCYLNGTLRGGAIGVFCGGGSDGGTFTAETCWAVGEYIYTYNPDAAIVSLDLIRTDGGTVNISNCRHNDEKITQGDKYSLIGTTSDVIYKLATFLGNQWTEANGELMLKPSAEYDETNITSPVFEGVTLVGAGPVPAQFSGGQFVGNYSPVAFTPNDASNLFIGTNNTLFWPNAANNSDGKYYVNACRAYFHVDPSASVREFRLNFGEQEASGIDNVKLKIENEDGAWYDLQGRRVKELGTRNSQLHKGLYINNGVKIVIK